MTGQNATEQEWPNRQFWFDPNLDDSEYKKDTPRWASTREEANLISSRTKDGLHAPVLDIDFPARLVPSRTPDHYHLFLNTTMTWWRYRVLLKILAWVGIVEKGYYRASVARRQTFVRKGNQ